MNDTTPLAPAVDTTDSRTWTVKLLGGDALVRRHGGTIVVARLDSPAHEAFYDGLEAALGAGGDTGAALGLRVARRIAGLVSQAEPEDVPDFALVSTGADGIVVLLVGDAVLEVAYGSGAVDTVTSRDAATWVDRVVRGPFDQMSVHVGTPGPLMDRTLLVEGTVGAAGFVLRYGTDAATREEQRDDQRPGTDAAPETVLQEAIPDVDAAPQAPAVAPVRNSPSPDFVAVSLTDSEPDAPPDPLPVAGVPQSTTARDDQEDDPGEVAGILCSRGHFNDPRSAFCASCGISTVQQTHDLVTRPRPPLGVLVLDDGSVYALDADYVVGREPEVSQEVQAGRAVPLALDDPAQTLSRVHAKILRSGWDVCLVDAHSANGSFVAAPGAADWTRLVPDVATTVTPGSRIQVGGRNMVFDSHRNA